MADGQAAIKEAPRELQADTLIEDVAHNLLKIMQDTKLGAKPWDKMNEGEQAKAIEKINAGARHLVGGVVRLVAAKAFDVIPAQIDSWKVKDGLQITLKAVESLEAYTALSKGSFGHLVFASVEEFRGEVAPLAATPDQPSLNADLEDDGRPVFDRTSAGAAGPN